MGLITGLILLPLAPVRGTVWIAERVLEQAELEAGDEGAVRAQLQEIQEARAAGTIGDEDAAAAEDALVERLLGGRSR
jgi:hypothetical protein